MSARRTVAAFAAILLAAGLAVAKVTKAELQGDLRDTSIVGDWLYDDIDAGFVKAAKDKRPICVVFR